LKRITKPRTPKGIASWMASIADEKKADDIIIMDMTEIETAPAEFFVLCSCDSENQMKAIIKEIQDFTYQFGMDKPRVEGLETNSWMIVDFFYTVFHIMHRDSRKYYQIEKIWGDAAFFDKKNKKYFTKARNFEYLND